MNYHISKSYVSFLLAKLVLVALLLSLQSVRAEDVFVTGWKGLTANTNDHLRPLSMIDTGFPNSGAGNASASIVSPVPIIPNNARRIHYGRVPGATWTLTPSNYVAYPNTPTGTGPYTFTALQHLGVYKIYLTKGQDNNASTNIVVQMTATGGDLADTNGAGATAIYLDMYQKGKPNGVWVHVGYITNTDYSPIIQLQHFSGEINDTDAVNNNAQRWYTDAIRFEYQDACAGVANEVSVTGPLVDGQSFVNLESVAVDATNVVVLVNNVQVAQTNLAPGFPGGNLTVLIPTALVNGDRVTAGQTKTGCSSTIPTTGPVVGGGPNVQLRAFLSCWQNSEFAGPVGASSTNTDMGINYFLKASSLSFGTAPAGGEPLPPSSCWQTITFSNDSDPAITPNGSSMANTDPYCALAGLMFAMDGADSGPYDIYVDQIMNGDTVIEDFEGYVPGSTNTFNAPKLATAPNPGSTYLSQPNSSTISQNNVFQGANALRIQWQWSDATDVRWAQALANASSGKRYPQLDTHQPITIRYLVLPRNETATKLYFPIVPVTDQSKFVGSNVTFTVQAAGQGTFSYQWSYQGTDISGATNSVYSKTNLQTTDTGNYAVTVTSDAGCSAVHTAHLTVSEFVASPALGYSVASGQITLTWTGAFTLQSAPSVTGPWTDITPTSGYQEAVDASAKYFRLRQ